MKNTTGHPLNIWLMLRHETVLTRPLLCCRLFIHKPGRWWHIPWCIFLVAASASLSLPSMVLKVLSSIGGIFSFVLYFLFCPVQLDKHLGFQPKKLPPSGRQPPSRVRAAIATSTCSVRKHPSISTFLFTHLVTHNPALSVLGVQGLIYLIHCHVSSTLSNAWCNYVIN